MTIQRLTGGRDAQISLGAGDGLTPHDQIDFHDGPTLTGRTAGSLAGQPATSRDDFPTRVAVTSTGTGRATLRRGADADNGGTVTLLARERRATMQSNLRELVRSVDELPLPRTTEQRIRERAAPPTVGEVMRENREARVAGRAWVTRAVEGGGHLAAHLVEHFAMHAASPRGGGGTVAVGLAVGTSVTLTTAAISLPVLESQEDAGRARRAAETRQGYDDEVRGLRAQARRSEDDGRTDVRRVELTVAGWPAAIDRDRMRTDGDYARAVRAALHERLDRQDLEARP